MELHSSEINELAKALSKFQGEVGSIPKTKAAKILMKSGGTYSYSYADLAGIWDGTRKCLSKNGLSLAQLYSETDKCLQLVTLLTHESGQWLKSILNIPTQGLKIQEIGSSMTYNRRYAHAAILGLATDDDDDGAAANDKPVERSSKQETPKQPEIELIGPDGAEGLESMIDPENEGEPRTTVLQYFYNADKIPFQNCFDHIQKRRWNAVVKTLNKLKDMKKAQADEVPF